MASYEISISTKKAKDKLDNLKADIKTTIEEIKATSLASISLDAKFKDGTIQKLKDELDSIDDLSLKIDAAITKESKKALDVGSNRLEFFAILFRVLCRYLNRVSAPLAAFSEILGLISISLPLISSIFAINPAKNVSISDNL